MVTMPFLMRFLSTPSARRATKTVGDRHKALEISIHALREEGDPVFSLKSSAIIHFYPRPPRGGRPRIITAHRPSLPFLSTPSARRATRPRWGSPPDKRISIHALREEGDLEYEGFTARQAFSIHALREVGDPGALYRMPLTGYFYPRPPRGGRPSGYYRGWFPEKFLSTPSARRATMQRGRGTPCR